MYIHPSDPTHEFIGVYGPESFAKLGMRRFEECYGNSTKLYQLSGLYYGVSVSNDGESEMEFVVHGRKRILEPGESYSAVFSPYMSVYIKASGAYRLALIR